MPVDLPLQVMPASAKECPVPEIEAELTSKQSHKIQDSAFPLALGATQASAELLEEQGPAFGRGAP